MWKFAIVIAGCLLLASVSGAEETSSAEGSDINVGDVMGFQQERHLKLWFAGRAGNWPLADYEIGKLKDGFDDIDKLLGGETVGKAVWAPIAALEKAIENRTRIGLRARSINLRRAAIAAIAPLITHSLSSSAPPYYPTAISLLHRRNRSAASRRRGFLLTIEVAHLARIFSSSRYPCRRSADDLSRLFRPARLAIDLSVGEGSALVQRVQRSRRSDELGATHQQ
jgi:hypothetical protein